MKLNILRMYIYFLILFLFTVVISIVLFLQIIIPSIKIGINLEKENTNQKVSKELYELNSKFNEVNNRLLKSEKEVKWLKSNAFTKYETEYNNGDDFGDRELLMEGMKYVENYYVTN